MATILRTPSLLLPPSSSRSRGAPWRISSVSMEQRLARASPLKTTCPPIRPLLRFRPFAADGEVVETEEAEQKIAQEEADDVDNDNGVNGDGVVEAEVKVPSIVMASLQSYKEALANDDQSTIADIEAFLLSIEVDKNSLAKKVASSSEELLTERDRVLRIIADFDNFRKRTERERLYLMENVQGEVVESLLPVLDNFERAKTQIKVETKAEEKINSSYQSIYKQFAEILISLGVEAVETIGKAFDPMLHEAIMREESTEFEEGVVIQEFRKGFKLGERLLRPSMVKVSAGPGPTKTETEAEESQETGNPV